MEKNLEMKIYEVLTEAGVPVKQAKKMAKKTAEKAEFFIWEKKQKEDKNDIPKTEAGLDRAVDEAVDAAVDAVSGSTLGKLLDNTMAELFGPEMGKMISQVENKVDDMSDDEADDIPAVSRMKEKKRIKNGTGNATFRTDLIDAVFNLTEEELTKGARYEIF